MDSISRVNVNNIYANLGGDSSSEEDITTVSDPNVVRDDASVVVKTTKSKRMGNMVSADQAFLPPTYETLRMEEPKQTNLKYRCQKFKRNNCSLGSLCLFSHDMDSTLPSRLEPTNVSSTVPASSPAYDGVMFDLESGSYQASVEAQGKFICIGYFAESSEAARARDIGLIRMIGFENAEARLCLDISNYDTIEVKELRSYDEALEDDGARLIELSDDSTNLFVYRWLRAGSSSIMSIQSQMWKTRQTLSTLND